MFTNYILPSKNCKEPIQRTWATTKSYRIRFFDQNNVTFLSGTTKLVRRFEKYNKGFVGLNVFEAHYIFMTRHNPYTIRCKIDLFTIPPGTRKMQWGPNQYKLALA